MEYNNGSQSQSDKTKPRLSWTGLLLIAFVLGVALFVLLSGWESAVEALKRLSWWQMATLSGLAGAHYVIRALRWHILVRVDGVPTSFGQNARHFFGGFAMTTTPGRVGEIVRLRWLHLETGRRVVSLLPIILSDRAIELAAIVALIALALTASSLGTQAVWLLLASGVVAVLIVCQPSVLEGMIGGFWRLIGRRKTRLFVKLRGVARQLRAFFRLPVLVPTLLIGIVGWGLEGLAFYLLLGWLDAPIGLAAATAIFLTAVLSGALSGLPGGLGSTEAATVALLILQGVPFELAVVATALIRISTLWFAVFLGLAVFPFAEMRAAAAAGKRNLGTPELNTPTSVS